MKQLVLAFLILACASSVEAGTISLVGDKDCFGLGGACPDGTRWMTDLGGSFFSSYQGPGDPLFTDKWSADISPTYTHTYALGTAVSATLMIRTAGLADFRGPWDVFFNGVVVGQFATGTGPDSYQEVLTHSFVIPIGLLTGSDTVILAINTPSVTDGYSIDYSELTINTTTSVPDPGSTLLLFGMGVVGLAAWRKRRV
jgi:hypothetical protein